MTRDVLRILLPAILLVALATGCSGNGTPLNAATPCSKYTELGQDDRQRAAAQVSVERKSGDAGNPMTYLNADQYCAQHPSATLGDAVGMSLSQYREQQAQQSAAASAAAAPTKTTLDKNGTYETVVTHLCQPAQSTANLVVATTNLTKSKMVVRGATAPVSVPPGSPTATTDQEDYRLISVRCPLPGRPTKLTFETHDSLSNVSVTFPDSAGEMLTEARPGRNYAILLFDNSEDSSSGLSTITIMS